MKVLYAGRVYHTERLPIQRLKNSCPKMEIKLFFTEKLNWPFIIVGVSEVIELKNDNVINNTIYS